MNSDYIKNLEASQMKTEVADFAVGDTVKVHKWAAIPSPPAVPGS